MAEISKDKFKIVGIDKTKSEQITRPNLTYWQDAWRRLKKNKVALFSLLILAILILMCIIQPIISNGGMQFKIWLRQIKDLQQNIFLELII